MIKSFGEKAPGFSSPTQLPDSDAQRQAWQEANRSWWESHPMTYDWDGWEDRFKPGSEAFFDELDRRFFGSVRHYLPWRERPFDTLIDFAGLADQDVLEIGCGQGTHAQLIAPHCKSFTGIDLTQRAVENTRKRLAQKGIPARIEQMDAEAMSFEDGSFDSIWSWGVIHHSSNTQAVLKEMNRVLRPGGKATVMIYNRSLLKYYVADVFVRGVVLGDLLRNRSMHQVNQAAADGAIARYYTQAEWTEACKGLFRVDSYEVMGQKSDVVLLPAGRVKQRLLELFPDSAARFITNKCQQGTFLVANMTKV